MQSTLGERDVARARERLGAAVDVHLRWVMQFAEQDLEELSTAEWLTLGAEVQAIVQSHRRPAQAGRHTDMIYAVDPFELREAQGRVREMLAQFTERGRVDIQKVDEYLMWGAASDEEPDVMRVWRVQRTRGLPAVMISVLMYLLEGCSRLGRLRRCPECKRAFVASRRQLRHAACAWSNRARTRKAKRQEERERRQRGKEAKSNG